jgi:hypothetical protein
MAASPCLAPGGLVRARLGSTGVNPASLPAGAEQHRLDRLGQAGVGVGDDQLHSGQAAGVLSDRRNAV